MPGITSVGALFFIIAKNNNWPINDKNFLEPALVGLFAPDILRELVGDTKNDRISGIATGRRRTHFAGGMINYPRFDEFKNYIENPDLFCAKDVNNNSHYVIVDPPINYNKENGFLEKTSWLYKENFKSVAFMIGLETALTIDSNWDYTVQQRRMRFNKRVAGIRKEYDEINYNKKEDDFIRVSSARSMLNKLYPRLDKKLLEEAEMTEKVFDGVRKILSKYYPEDLLNKAFDEWWRIPVEKDLEIGEKWLEENLEKAFPNNVLEYYKEECIEKISNNYRIQKAIKQYKKKCLEKKENVFDENNDICSNCKDEEDSVYIK